MSVQSDFSGLDRLIQRFRKLQRPQRPTALMVTFVDIIKQDNQRRVLSGLDKDGVPMTPVTYRPKHGPAHNADAQARLQRLRKEATAAGRHGQRGRGRFMGIGVQGTTINNNLTSAQYRLLAGPPLAPRGAFSRVITNLRFKIGELANGVYECVAYWDEVVNTKGRRFLGYHFDGAKLKKGGRLPKRDLRGISPEAMQKARRAARAWLIDQIRSQR